MFVVMNYMGMMLDVNLSGAAGPTIPAFEA